MTESDAEVFCAQILHRLVGSLSLYVGDRPLAEEIAQEALARAWERWDRVGSMDSPEAWVFKTARNLARRRLSRRVAERRVVALRADRRSTPDLADAVAVRAAVSSLPERQRATLIARYFMELSVGETSELLGCAEGTVKAATHQAIKSLRESGLIDEAESQEAM